MFHVLIDHTKQEPIYLQIYEFILNEIRLGNLSCHERLPSGRTLAQDLNISRNTVTMAYMQLESEGYIEAVSKKGYYVKELDGLLDMRLTRIRKPETGEAEKARSYQVDFSPFGIDLRYAPYRRWQKLSKETILDTNANLFQNGDSQGDISLRRAIREYLHRSRGVNCTEQQIIIGAGTDYLLMLLTRILPEPMKIAIENPVYQQAYKVLRSFQYPMIPIPINEEGMDVQKLRESDANLVFVTPSHQFPLGVVMSINRRMQLLNWAYQQEERYIIEDDYDSEFRYQGKPIPSLQGIDTKNKVIYLGTLSKAIAPSIRIGYMVLPENLLERYRKEVSFYATTVSRMEQEIVRRFIDEGFFERHLNRMRSIYRTKRDCLLGQLGTWRNTIRIMGETAGVHILLEFPNTDFTETELVEKAYEAGVRVYPVSDYYIKGKSEKPTILLGYAKLSEEEIAKGVALLEQAWKNVEDLS